MMTKHRVVCAAVRKGDTIICSPRHFDRLMRAIVEAFADEGWDCTDLEQGFVDQFGAFMTREEALVVAKAAGQIVRRCGGDEHRLYSENLY
jgi:hypothetical protein